MNTFQGAFRSPAAGRVIARGLPGLVLSLALFAPAAAWSDVVVSSPDGRASISLEVPTAGEPRWSATWRGRPALDPAPVGLRFRG